MIFGYTNAMKYKELKQILLKHYAIDSVKHMLVRKNPQKPSYAKAEMLENLYQIPIGAWKDIRSWLDTQAIKKSKAKKSKGAKK